MLANSVTFNLHPTQTISLNDLNAIITEFRAFFGKASNTDYSVVIEEAGNGAYDITITDDIIDSTAATKKGKPKVE